MTLPVYNIESGKKTPGLLFNSETGHLALKGKSIPENATKIFEPAIEWVNEYIKAPAEETNFHIDLDYFNTASSIWITRIIKQLATINHPGKLLIVHLYFYIEDFDEMEYRDMEEAISPVTDVLQSATVSIGVKIYGKNDSNSILKQKLILF